MRNNEPNFSKLSPSYRFVLIMTLPTPCDQCRKGWIPDGSWYQPCPVCEGLGELTLTRLATLTGLDEKTLKRVWTGKRIRLRTAEKVLRAYAKLVEPKKQTEIFR